MELSALDMVVLLAIGWAGLMGLLRGFVTELLSLASWALVVVALKLFHLPLTRTLSPLVGTRSGAAVLAFALLAGVCYFGGRMVARAIGGRTRRSIIGPLDRTLGLGFGLLQGLVLVSLAFLLLMLVMDTVDGGPQERPDWVTHSATYPLLNTTSAAIGDFVARRRKGAPVFGGEKRSAGAVAATLT